MGYIYIITNSVNGMQYVGQTTGDVLDRFAQHKYSAIRYAKHLQNPGHGAYKGTCTYLYNAMNSYGFDKFSVQEVTDCDASELDELEIHFIQECLTLCPNGYNLTTGGGHFQHCEATKKIISDKVKSTMLSDIDSFRTSDKTRGLPAYIAYKHDGSYEAYYVNNHPLCKRKYFSASKYQSIDIAREECRKFVNELNERGLEHLVTGPNGAPVKGLRPLQNGYQVRKSIKGKVFEKSFNDKNLTREENLQNAIQYINSINK